MPDLTPEEQRLVVEGQMTDAPIGWRAGIWIYTEADRVGGEPEGRPTSEPHA